MVSVLSKFAGLILAWFDMAVTEAMAQVILRSFPYGFASEISKSIGARTLTRPCGCVLRMEHVSPGKWVLEVDYSNCVEHKARRGR